MLREDKVVKVSTVYGVKSLFVLFMRFLAVALWSDKVGTGWHKQ